MGSTPHNWKCAKCKRTHVSSGGRAGWYAAFGKPAPTGRVRNPASYRPSVEYRCEICGHVGWSRHPAAVGEARRLGYAPPWPPWRTSDEKEGSA